MTPTYPSDMRHKFSSLKLSLKPGYQRDTATFVGKDTTNRAGNSSCNFEYKDLELPSPVYAFLWYLHAAPNAMSWREGFISKLLHHQHLQGVKNRLHLMQTTGCHETTSNWQIKQQPVGGHPFLYCLLPRRACKLTTIFTAELLSRSAQGDYIVSRRNLQWDPSLSCIRTDWISIIPEVWIRLHKLFYNRSTGPQLFGGNVQWKTIWQWDLTAEGVPQAGERGGEGGGGGGPSIGSYRYLSGLPSGVVNCWSSTPSKLRLLEDLKRRDWCPSEPSSSSLPVFPFVGAYSWDQNKCLRRYITWQ